MRQKRNRNRAWVVGMIFCGLLAGGAHAARRAKVDVDGTALLRAPRPDGGVLLKLKKGQRVAASNYPTAGYYKVRTADGTLGWVKADTLILGPMPDLRHNEPANSDSSE